MADPLSIAGSVVGILSLGITVTQSLFDYYAASRSQHSDVENTLRRLKSMQELLKTLLKRVDNRKCLPNDSSLIANIEKSVGECEELILELQEEANKFKKVPMNNVQSAIKAVSRRIEYPFRESTLKKLDEDIGEIINCLNFALQLLQQDSMDHIQDDTKDIKQLLNLVMYSLLSLELQDWLKAPDPSIDFNEACEKRQDQGTGLWLVEGETFNAWLRDPRSFLWLRGFAGCGKSVLCSTAIQYVFRHQRSNPEVRMGIAFFFFKFNEERKQDTSGMLRALVLQLSVQLDSQDDLSHLHDKYRHATPSNENLLTCLHQIVRKFSDVYILVDALDESPMNKHRHTMLKALVDMRKWEDPGFHLLVTSRDEVDIRVELDIDLGDIIEMKNVEVDQDIATFVAEHLRFDRRFHKWAKFYDQIELALMKQANGVFRWVECQLNELAHCPANKHILDRLLQTLPASLDETYARILRNIPSITADYAQRMLTILICAIRPLTQLELVDALAVELCDNPRFDHSRRFEDVSSLQNICPGFIEVSTNPTNGETIVRIAHFSVQEYLKAERILQQDVRQFHIRMQDAHNDMASICLTLLLEPRILQLEDNLSVKRAYPLIGYAAQYWPLHIKQCTHEAIVSRQILELFRDANGSFSVWNRIQSSPLEQTLIDRTYSAPICKAAALGLQHTLIELLGEYQSTDKFVVLSRTFSRALHEASRNGHKTIVQILVEAGVDVDTRNLHSTPLIIASRRRQIETMKVLLEAGADVNTSHIFYGTPLSSASNKGLEEIVKILLEKGADINAQDRHSKTALHTALEERHLHIVNILLQKGADGLIKDDLGRSPLYYAIIQDEAEIFDRLFTKNSQVNSRDYYGMTVLSVAVRCGRKKMIEQLLAIPDVDINSQDNFGRTPLWWAQKQGYIDIAERLHEYANSASLNILAVDLPTGGPKTFDNCCKYCVVCLCSNECWLRCYHCAHRDFNICRECQRLGAHCLDKSHTLETWPWDPFKTKREPASLS